MPIDDQDLIQSLRTAVDDRTDLHYTRGVPKVRTSPSWPAVALTTAAVAALAVGAAVALDRDPAAPTASPEPSVEQPAAAGYVANDANAVARVLDDRVEEAQGGICENPETRDDPACDQEVQPPYPLLMTMAEQVPDSATHYPALDGYDSDTRRGWVGIDESGSAKVWLETKDGDIIGMATEYFATGEEFAEWLMTSLRVRS